MNGTKLVIGMPAGSLADPNRGGNLISLLGKAGFNTKGYEAGGPSSFPTVNFFMGWDGRPQEFGSQLSLGELDVAIAGDDWIRERVLEFRLEYGQEIRLERVMSLQRGGVRIVGIADTGGRELPAADFIKSIAEKKSLLTIVSEMPYLALDWVREKLSGAGLLDRFESFSVQKYKTPPKIDKGILIYETWGKTEAKVKNGGADFGLEITQSGSALKNYGLSIIDEIMSSETSIWIPESLKSDKGKMDLLRMFLLNLYGTINAENKVMLTFNVPLAATASVDTYLGDNRLFGNEPTVNRGENWAEYSIQVETSGGKLPVAQIRWELARMGARSIDTIPVISSIPGLDVITV
jgi:ATP phosphoribosyltransferase